MGAKRKPAGARAGSKKSKPRTKATKLGRSPAKPRPKTAAVGKSGRAQAAGGETTKVLADRPALARVAETRGKYVYCIIESTEPLTFGAIGIGAEPAPVHTINYKNVAAVVSDTPIEVHEPTRENVLAHERVNETVM